MTRSRIRYKDTLLKNTFCQPYHKDVECDNVKVLMKNMLWTRIAFNFGSDQYEKDVSRG